MLRATSSRAAVAKEATGTFLLTWDRQHRANLGNYYRVKVVLRYILTAKHA